jgi:chemotaxis protein methyltransferase CheR
MLELGCITHGRVAWRTVRNGGVSVKDTEWVAFLQWALPQLELRWPGFRRVRAQVCKRIRRRMATLACPDLAAYRRYLSAHEAEWAVLDACCRITVSRFYRDRGVFATLTQSVLPALARVAQARGAPALRVWCAGCASGEEPYTLAIAWRQALAGRFPGLPVEILATDVDADLLARARQACYPWSALKDLPPTWRDAAFQVQDELWCLRPAFAAPVRFLLHDLREPLPEDDFDLVCCRNLAFTYFGRELQWHVAQVIHDRLQPGGVLVLGIHERLPEGQAGFVALSARLALYRKPGP